MESVGRYLMSVAAAAIICGILEKLYPKSGTAGTIIKMMCGVFMVLTAVSPWLKVSVYDFSAYAQSFSQQAYEASNLGLKAADEYRRTIISEKVTTYILDKAAQLDLQISVEVTLSDDERGIPCGLVISGAVPEEKKQKMQQILEEELGIGRADQIWTG